MKMFEKLFTDVAKINDYKITLYDTEAIVMEQKMTKNPVDIGGLTVIIDLRTRGERDEPHFHLYVKGAESTNKGRDRKSFHTCIRLDEAEYFKHGSKQGELSAQEIDDLVQVLNSKYYKNPSYTVWEYMVIIWNMIPDRKYSLPTDIKMPDYTKLK